MFVERFRHDPPLKGVISGSLQIALLAISRQLAEVSLDGFPVVRWQIATDLLKCLLAFGRGEISPTIFVVEVLRIDFTISANITGGLAILHGRALASVGATAATA